MTIEQLKERLTAEINDLEYTMMADVYLANSPDDDFHKICSYIDARWRIRWTRAMTKIHQVYLRLSGMARPEFDPIYDEIVHRQRDAGPDIPRLQRYVEQRRRPPQ